jgi:hypothetical protein
MTEEEAKTKWCPFARTTQTDGINTSGARNRVGNSDTMTTDADRLLGMQCIGSACMAWRAVVTRERPRLVQENEVDAWKRVGWTESGEPDGFGLVAIIPPPPQSEGFCGLAGKP